MKNFLPIFILSSSLTFGQLQGTIVDDQGAAIAGATIFNKTQNKGNLSDWDGTFTLPNPKVSETLIFSYVGFQPQQVVITPEIIKKQILQITLQPDNALDEVVITGTLQEVKRSESPVPVEVYQTTYFNANPTPSVFDAVQMINGIRPQLNCNICNTGDIHINGQEGANTMVLIDGLPIVSGLATVYGLTGIPQSLIEQIEVIKGPASTLYGSEAIGGVINLITKLPENAPQWSWDSFVSSWGESNTDLGATYRWGKAKGLLGINYFNYSNPMDTNKDNFTDVTLQDRISIFNKISTEKNKIAFRLFYEDRWGGEMNWTPRYRGGVERYGESIYTARWEIFGSYNYHKNGFLQYSFNEHYQDARYGDTPYKAFQQIAFVQAVQRFEQGNHSLLTGLSYRQTNYNDNTPATSFTDRTFLPGLFLQDEWKISNQHRLLLGMRYDFHSTYGAIYTPRINYKWNSPKKTTTLRLSAGTGYRVVNVFTEDHAALTGARDVVFQEDLSPEESWNTNINWVQKIYSKNGFIFSVDSSLFYTDFSNRILPDYESNPNEIRYANLDQNATTQGLTLNTNSIFPNGANLQLGITWIDTRVVQNGIKQQPLLTEKFSSNYSFTYPFQNIPIRLDWTGTIIGPMRLPLLSDTDPRSPFSPWIHDSNLQIRWIKGQLEIYGGIKNLFNFTPDATSIARSFDPFDKQVNFDTDGNALQTVNNPYGLTFDPTYVYYSNQGRRGFIGLRMTVL